MTAGGVSISTNAADLQNTIQIVLDDTSNPGYVTATITATGNPAAVSYWNFSGISFTGNADTDGSITNVFTLQTPYQADVVGFGATGSGTPLSSKNWQVDAKFSESPTPGLTTAFLDLFNADSLTVNAGTLGGDAQSTIGGEFQSPTDLTNGGKTGADIRLIDSALGLSDSGAITTYKLRLDSTNGGIAIGSDVATVGDLTIVGKAALVSLGDGASLKTISSQAGDIGVSASTGPIAVSGVSFQSLAGGISISTPSTLKIVDGAGAGAAASFTAPAAYSPTSPEIPDGLVRLSGTLGLTLPVALPVTASRLELATQSAAEISLSQLAVGSLKATLSGSLTVTNSVPLQVSDFKNTPSVEISAQNVTIQSPVGLRVVDGINAAGKLVLSTYQAGTTTNPPTTPVDFVVTGTGDNAVASDPFAGTLRDMIKYVNANGLVAASGSNPAATGQPMRILFDETGSAIATGGTVTLAASLPAFAKAVTIDGSLPAAPLGGVVGINGNGVVNTGITLGTGSSGSTVRDVALHGFRGSAIIVQSADNLISGTTLGANRTGAIAGNAIGIEISGSSAVRNVVGVKTVGIDSGNTIVGNTTAGLMVRDRANFTGVYGNTIGSAGQGNVDGIRIINSIGTIIGGTQPDLANTIDSNTGSGVRLTNVTGVATTYGAQLIGNDIVDNVSAGILVEGGSRNVIGGTGVGAGNTLDGNGIGVHMRSNGLLQTSANQLIGNAITDSTTGGVLIDQGFANLVQGNTVSRSADWGVRVFRAAATRTQAANRIVQNTITSNGNTDLEAGIVLENSSGQTVGGRGTSANVVAQNGGNGILIVAGVGPNAAGANLVEGNLVGTDAAGTPLGNSFDGIRVQGSLANVIRGNTVRSNTLAGISVYDAVAPAAASGNQIVSNAVSDNATGILVSGGARTQVGGATKGLGNWVFRNGGDGIRVTSSSATGPATATVVRGNLIGLSTTNVAAGNGENGISLVNTVGSIADSGNIVTNSRVAGIRVEGGSRVAIGGAGSLGNTIQFTAGTGIEILSPVTGRTDTVTVSGNVIRSNQGYGILVNGSTVSGITIGRNIPGVATDKSGNTITGNSDSGVYINGAKAVSVYGNSISGNGGQPIEWATVPATTATLTSATKRVAGQRAPQFDVAGSVNRSVSTAAEAATVLVYGLNSATNERHLLGRVVVSLKAGVASSDFRLIVSSGGRQFDSIQATVQVGLGTVSLSNPLAV